VAEVFADSEPPCGRAYQVNPLFLWIRLVFY
jgi:hypothetical protein